METKNNEKLLNLCLKVLHRKRLHRKHRSESNLLIVSLAKNRYQEHSYLSAKTRFLASNRISHVFSITAMISTGRSIFPSCLAFRRRSPQNFSQNSLVNTRVICIRLILINVAASSSRAHLRP